MTVADATPLPWSDGDRRRSGRHFYCSLGSGCRPQNQRLALTGLVERSELLAELVFEYFAADGLG